jgi:creatinine amidohydrolase
MSLSDQPIDDVFELARMTSPEAGNALNVASVALIPVGATEQHGPNLAMGADFTIAGELARRVAEKSHPRCVIVPAMPFGLSGHHMGFPGTISISPESFMSTCFDVVRSLSVHGLERFLFINGHQGNQAVLNVVANKIRYELGSRAAVAYLSAQAGDVVSKHVKTHRWGHACEIESSVAMYLAPDIVRVDQLSPGDLIEEYGAYEDNYKPHALLAPKSFAERTRNGAFGDATQATVEVGEEIVTTAVDRISAFVHDFAIDRPAELQESPSA